MVTTTIGFEFKAGDTIILKDIWVGSHGLHNHTNKDYFSKIYVARRMNGCFIAETTAYDAYTHKLEQRGQTVIGFRDFDKVREKIISQFPLPKKKKKKVKKVAPPTLGDDLFTL